MELNEYVKFTRIPPLYPGGGDMSVQALSYCALGLTGEAGEVANKIKKLVRDGDDGTKRTAIRAELGDVFWYLVRLCDEIGVHPGQVLDDNVEKLLARRAAGTVGGSGDNR